ncbi:MAG: hypothetical protein ACYTGN_14815 [Planctomycetota bacterium]|jgi:hypothetical protein
MRLVLALLCLAGLAAGDRAVRRDGSIVHDDVMRVEKRSLIWGEKRPKTESLDAYLLVEKADGTHVWSANWDARVRGYLALARRERRAGLAQAANNAIKARDHVLARDLLERAEDAGFAGKDADKLRRKILAAEKRPKVANAKKAAAARAAARVIEGASGRILRDRAIVALPEDRLGGFRLLREALRRAPADKLAIETLAKYVPAELATDHRAWLDWQLDVQRRGFLRATGKELELKRARHHWRPDLYGVGSKEILLITALKDYELVGRCLAHARLVCRALGGLFKTDKPVRTKAGPLVLFLYMDRKAYKEHAGDYREIDDSRFLEWSTAHWSAQDDITRAFWPTDPDDERRFLRVFRRTIARHWMNSRNPTYSISQAARSSRNPGWWLARGLRTIVAQGHYDIEAGTWDLFNERGTYMDRLVAVSEQQAGRLLPWKDVFALNLSRAYKLPSKPDIPVALRWSLHGWKISTYSVYLGQAVSAARYLFHADNGRHRRAFLDAVVAHYRGERESLGPQKAFGLSEAALGSKALEFANSVADGWVPGDNE